MSIASLWRSTWCSDHSRRWTYIGVLSRESLRVNGTVTGEHGVGIGKKDLLIDEFGMAGINTMKAIKKALDPLNILNPGKVI
jgi:D-lactate dehydrogenase (cytochrome)